MMTEEEAKKKWCPHTQVAVVESGAASNRESFALASQKGYDLCLGSACMAWRWSVGPMANDAPDVKYKGYCGLAGKP